eukprot:44722-Eustigmatos_ZCMA.PRE.1
MILDIGKLMSVQHAAVLCFSCNSALFRAVSAPNAKFTKNWAQGEWTHCNAVTHVRLDSPLGVLGAYGL